MRRHEPVIAQPQCTDSVVFPALVSTKEKMVNFGGNVKQEDDERKLEHLQLPCRVAP